MVTDVLRDDGREPWPRRRDLVVELSEEVIDFRRRSVDFRGRFSDAAY
jgi:hypothetical protein